MTGHTLVSRHTWYKIKSELEASNCTVAFVSSWTFVHTGHNASLPKETKKNTRISRLINLYIIIILCPTPVIKSDPSILLTPYHIITKHFKCSLRDCFTYFLGYLFYKLKFGFSVVYFVFMIYWKLFYYFNFDIRFHT